LSAVLGTIGVLGVVGVGRLAPAGARHNFSMLEVRPGQAAAGEEVTVSGFSYTRTATVRFGAIDGPVLARLDPTANNDITGTVRIPADARPGRHVIYAMHEDAAGRVTRFPGRAAVVVTGPGGVPANLDTGLELEERPQGLLGREGVPVGRLVLVGLAAAGGASLLAPIVWVVLTRRRPGASPGAPA
jgi:hypothetical protein